MASVKDHRESIKRNEKFLAFLKKDGNYPDWAVVVVFYIAVHYGRALLAHQNEQVSQHGMFAAKFLRVFKDKKCYEHFEILKNESEKSRYDNVRFSWAEVENLETQRLDEFKKCMQRLGQPVGFSI